MLRTDFENQLYTAEVLRITKVTTAPADAIEPLLVGKWSTAEVPRGDGTQIALHHGLVASRVAYHRAIRKRINDEGKEEEIPRTKEIRGYSSFLYDVLLAQHRDHVVVAVPFHALAQAFFVKVDSRLGGTRTMYEKLNITKIIIHLAAQHAARGEPSDRRIGVTRCQLTYDDPIERRRDVEQVRLTGANLSATEIYAQLITPVLRPSESDLRVTPVLLGFASFVGGVRKSSALTDRHGNFKLHVGPGLRQLLRVFELLDDIEAIKGVVTATSNVPILQASAIEDET
jgi:hypothetical protein